MLVRSSCIALVGIAAVEAFAPSALLRAAPSQRGHVGVSMVSGGESVSVSRRKALVLLSTLPLALGSSSPAEAKKAGTARLNAEGNPETKEERGERIRCVRLPCMRVRSLGWARTIGLGSDFPGYQATEKRSRSIVLVPASQTFACQP